MDAEADFDLWTAWDWLEIQVVLGKNAHVSASPNSPPTNKPILDLLMPSLLLVRSVSVLDQALRSYIENSFGSMPKGYRDDLNGRLRLLVDQNLLTDGVALHQLRIRRNELAHESTDATGLRTFPKWKEVDDALALERKSLMELGFVNLPVAKYEFFWTRDVDIYGDENPSPRPGVVMTHHFKYGVKNDGGIRCEFQSSYDYSN